MLDQDVGVRLRRKKRLLLIMPMTVRIFVVPLRLIKISHFDSSPKNRAGCVYLISPVSGEKGRIFPSKQDLFSCMI